jgi:uncharacterized protein
MRVDTVLLKVASRCNLDCGYCYVYNMGDDSWRSMPKRMDPQVMAETCAQLGRLQTAQDHPFAVVLHGGEPLLLGAARLRELFSLLQAELGHRCSINVQTNGVLIDDAVLDLCAEHGVQISVSLDGPAAVHDRNRKDRRGRDSHAAVVAGIARAQAHREGGEIFSGVLAVVDPTSDPHDVYDYFASLGIPSVDFLYRDGNHATLPFGKAAVGSVEYGSWMSTILDRYLSDPQPPRIRVLDDMMRLMLGRLGSKEGVGLTDFGILVIDTDGSITKNDTLKSTPEGDRFSEPWHVMRSEMSALVATQEFLKIHRMQQPSSVQCRACPELAICGGGMVTHRFSAKNGYENPTVFCADQMLLIARMRDHLSRQVGLRSAA